MLYEQFVANVFCYSPSLPYDDGRNPCRGTWALPCGQRDLSLWIWETFLVDKEDLPCGYGKNLVNISCGFGRPSWKWTRTSFPLIGNELRLPFLEMDKNFLVDIGNFLGWKNIGELLSIWPLFGTKLQQQR